MRTFLALVMTVVMAAGWAAGQQAAGSQAPAQPNPTPFFLQPNVHTNVVIDTNQTLFTVLAAINVAGYNDGLNAPNASPLRKQVRARLLAHPLPVYQDLAVFYRAHLKDDPARNLSQYISLAIFLGDPPDFRLQVRPQDLPAQVVQLQGFVPLLRRFYQDANIGDLWRQVEPQYNRETATYAGQIRAVIAQVNDFFRLPTGALGRRLYIYPDAMASPRQSNARSYLDNYFIVIPLNNGTRVDDIRHIYLHYILDPEVLQFPGAVDRLQPVLALVQRAPALSPAFKHDLSLYATENIIRAVQILLDGGTKQQQLAKVQQNVQEGFVLTRYWYDSLVGYRNDVVSFRQFFPQTAWDIRVGEIEKVARQTAFINAPEPETVTQPVRMVSLLDQGEERLDANDLAGASRLAKEALLQPKGDHATAHYLLALVATHQNQPALAREFFRKSLAESSASDIHVRTWANIYLGRIDDLEHNRAAALEHYHAALAVADSPAARQIAEAGLKTAFAPAQPAKKKP